MPSPCSPLYLASDLSFAGMWGQRRGARIRGVIAANVGALILYLWRIRNESTDYFVVCKSVPDRR